MREREGQGMKRVYALLLACLLCLVSCGEQREEAPGEDA